MSTKSKFTDESPMPFGKHKGLPLSEVPDDYLLWLYYDTNLKDGPLRRYIVENLDALNANTKQEEQ